MLSNGTERYEAELDAEANVERILAELRDALERIRSLGTLVTVCGSCRDIREPDGEWQSLEHFLQVRLGVRFSHGLCPDCGSRLLGEIEGSGSGRAQIADSTPRRRRHAAAEGHLRERRQFE